MSTRNPYPNVKASVEFITPDAAKAVGKHPNTITRWINIGRVRTEKGRIPLNELGKFTS